MKTNTNYSRATTAKTAKTLLGLLCSTSMLMPACTKSNPSFSISGTSQSFQQSADSFAVNQIDILWVVDNSGSMQGSQANLASNFSAFITKFQTLGLDYHMAVIGTDAYLAGSYFNNAYSNYSATAAKFKDGFVGQYGNGVSGIFVMDKANTTPTIFSQNIAVGTTGSGDERAFSSIVQAIGDPSNVASGFRRPGAFLSVIILSDEDDFSGDASYCDHFQSSCSTQYVGDHNYAAPAPELQPVSFYVNALDTYVGKHNGYSVSTMSADSAACLTTLNAAVPNPARIVAQRYPQISALTGGVAGSLCGNFAATLDNIATSVIQLASTFTLAQAANPASIIVTVNGTTVPQNATNGWQYNATTFAISFYGTAIPAAGANISIIYTPASAHQ